MRRTLVAMGLLLAVAGGAVPAHADTLTNPSLSDCQGLQRSEYKPDGFGALQAFWVKHVHKVEGTPYGQWLKDNKAC